MNDYIERLKSLQPFEVEGQRLGDTDQWPAQHHCVFRECQFPRLLLRAEHFHELRFENCTFGDIQIDGATMDRVDFDRCEIQRIQVSGGALSKVTWHECQLGPWTLTQTKLKDVGVISSTLQSVACVDVVGRHCSFIESKAECLSLRRGHWQDLTLAGVCVAAMEATEVVLERLIWGRSQFDLATLTNCIAQASTWFDCQIALLKMSNVQIGNASWQNSVIAGGRMEHCSMPSALWAGCEIRDLELPGCDLSQAILDGAHMEACDMRSVRARRVSLRNAHLKNVDLSGADLTGLNATGASVDGLRLAGADCSDGILHGHCEADWAGAELDGAEFKVGVDMDDSQWWRTTRPGPREGALV